VRVVSALLLLRASPMCCAPLSPISSNPRLRGPNKEQPRQSAPFDHNQASASSLGVAGEAGAHMRVVSVSLFSRALQMCWAPSVPISFCPRLRGPNKEQPQTVSAHPCLQQSNRICILLWRGSERALERGECLVDLEGLANILGSSVADLIVVKSARPNQQGEPQIVSPPPHKNASASFNCGEAECALESGKCRVDLEGVTDVLGTFCTDVIINKTARVKPGEPQTVSTPPIADNTASTFALGW
jgi:hypothetical protein